MKQARRRALTKGDRRVSIHINHERVSITDPDAPVEPKITLRRATADRPALRNV